MEVEQDGNHAEYSKRARFVGSYALSNGERFLRSPELPNSPNVVAVIVLLAQNAPVLIARYDISPVSNLFAVCRARLASGHFSRIVKILSLAENLFTIDT